MLLWCRHCSNKTGGRVEEVLSHHGTEPLHLVWDAVVCPGQRVEVCMDTLSALLTHEPKSHSTSQSMEQHAPLKCTFWGVQWLVGNCLCSTP